MSEQIRRCSGWKRRCVQNQHPRPVTKGCTPMRCVHWIWSESQKRSSAEGSTASQEKGQSYGGLFREVSLLPYLFSSLPSSLHASFSPILLPDFLIGREWQLNTFRLWFTARCKTYQNLHSFVVLVAAVLGLSVLSRGSFCTKVPRGTSNCRCPSATLTDSSSS